MNPVQFYHLFLSLFLFCSSRPQLARPGSAYSPVPFTGKRNKRLLSFSCRLAQRVLPLKPRGRGLLAQCCFTASLTFKPRSHPLTSRVLHPDQIPIRFYPRVYTQCSKLANGSDLTGLHSSCSHLHVKCGSEQSRFNPDNQFAAGVNGVYDMEVSV